MLDGVSLDQLRAFITESTGTFSATGRKLYRMQWAASGPRNERQAGMVHEKVNSRE